MYSFPNLEPVHCSMSGSKRSFLTYTQISQEAGRVVWYSHLLQNFPQFVVIQAVKGFGVVNKVEGFLELSCFFYDPTDIWKDSYDKKSRDITLPTKVRIVKATVSPVVIYGFESGTIKKAEH